MLIDPAGGPCNLTAATTVDGIDDLAAELTKLNDTQRMQGFELAALRQDLTKAGRSEVIDLTSRAATAELFKCCNSTRAAAEQTTCTRIR